MCPACRAAGKPHYEPRTHLAHRPSASSRTGKKTAEIRKELGEDWDIWTMGCPEGESPDQMRDRCDAMIKKVVDLAECVVDSLSSRLCAAAYPHPRLSLSAHHGKEETAGSHGDIVIISHGHFSRCFMSVSLSASSPLLSN